MISNEESRIIALDYYKRLSAEFGAELVIIDAATEVFDIGIVYHGTTPQNLSRDAPAGSELEAGKVYEWADVAHLFEGVPLGLNPILVDHRDGSVHELGTGDESSVYVDNYKRSGDPWDFR